MYKFISCLLLCTSLGCAIGAQASPILSDSDVTLYQEVLDLQQNGKFKAAQKKQSELTNDTLLGYILYDRYFSKDYRVSKKELTRWFQKYNDLAVATDMYALAKQKKATLPSEKPKGLFGGNAKTCSAVFRPEPIDLTRGHSFSYLSPANAKQAKKIMRRIYVALNHGKTKTARNLVESAEAKKLFSRLDHDSARTALAFSYFIDGEDKLAMKLITPVIQHSGDKIPQAYWVAGLVSWRQQKYAEAASYFTSSATHPKTYPILQASGSVWAARSYLKSGQFSEVRPALERAAQYQRLFYGIVAMRMLAHDLNHVWDTPAKADDDLSGNFSHPALERFYALEQIGQESWARQELAKLYLEADEEARGILLLISEQNGFDNDLLALSGNLGDGSTRYPAPNWTPKDGWKVDKALVYAFVRQESCFNKRAESNVGALGLMQLMPSTARELARSLNFPYQKQLLKEPEYNLSLGQNYLLHLMEMPAIQNNIMYLATAYNAGPGNLIKWKKKTKTDDPLLFLESVPSRETRSFIERIVVNYWIYRILMNQPLASLDSVIAGEWPCYQTLECRQD